MGENVQWAIINLYIPQAAKSSTETQTALVEKSETHQPPGGEGGQTTLTG